ncbi:MAG: hypothetical protein RLZZ612_2372 [Pseudomonadota bacterium]|jgi:hypothetical protein
MPLTSSSFDQLAARVERLLIRYEELHRTNELQYERICALELELDLYRSRYAAARSRIDDLIARLPTASSVPGSDPSSPKTPA